MLDELGLVGLVAADFGELLGMLDELELLEVVVEDPDCVRLESSDSVDDEDIVEDGVLSGREVAFVLVPETITVAR